MAKTVMGDSFSKATISRNDDGDFIITEITKDDETPYNLTKVLEKWLDVDGLSLTIKRDAIIPSNIEE